MVYTQKGSAGASCFGPMLKSLHRRPWGGRGGGGSDPCPPGSAPEPIYINQERVKEFLKGSRLLEKAGPEEISS